MPKRKKGTKPAMANKKPKQEVSNPSLLLERLIADSINQVNPTSLPPPTAPTPPTPEVFPTEIFALILSNFRFDPNRPISYRSQRDDPDKAALAQCMRVSTSFKALAAPLLYEVMDWKDMKEAPLQVVNEGKVLRGRTAKWLTMNTEARPIRMVNFRPHDRKSCSKTGKLIRQRPINIPVLKLKLSDNHNYGECIECPLALDFAPKKVVVTSHEDLRPTYSQIISSRGARIRHHSTTKQWALLLAEWSSKTSRRHSVSGELHRQAGFDTIAIRRLLHA